MWGLKCKYEVSFQDECHFLSLQKRSELSWTFRRKFESSFVRWAAKRLLSFLRWFLPASVSSMERSVLWSRAASSVRLRADIKCSTEAWLSPDDAADAPKDSKWPNSQLKYRHVIITSSGWDFMDHECCELHSWGSTLYLALAPTAFAFYLSKKKRFSRSHWHAGSTRCLMLHANVTEMAANASRIVLSALVLQSFRIWIRSAISQV